MSNPTVAEMNLTIAEYMGIKKDENGCVYDSENYILNDIPRYSSDWNALLPVIHKLRLADAYEDINEPEDYLWTPVFFNIKQEHQEMYDTIKSLSK